MGHRIDTTSSEYLDACAEPRTVQEVFQWLQYQPEIRVRPKLATVNKSLTVMVSMGLIMLQEDGRYYCAKRK